MDNEENWERKKRITKKKQLRKMNKQKEND